MNLKEFQTSSTSLFQGCVLNLRKDTVTLPNGETAFREVIEHNGGACVAALDDNGNLLMVRQYRYAAGQTMWEIPAGKLEKGEDPAVCAARELEEEAGYTAEELIPLGYFFPTPAYCQEKILRIGKSICFNRRFEIGLWKMVYKEDDAYKIIY